MKYPNCLAVLIFGAVEFSIPVSTKPTECIHVDSLDAGDLRTCAKVRVGVPNTTYVEHVDEYGIKHYLPKVSYAEKNYAIECQDTITFFTKALPSLLRCTRNSKKWSWVGESVLVMEEVVLRLVMELNSSRVDDMRKLLKNFPDQTRSSFNCTSYARSVDPGLAQCFVRSGNCQNDLTNTFLCLVNQALDVLDPASKKRLTCELFAIISYPFLPQSWRQLTMGLKEINAVCPQYYQKQEEIKTDRRYY